MVIDQMKGRPRGRRSGRLPVNPYTLVSQAPNGHLRTERFKSAAEYRVRLVGLGSGERPVSLDELIDVLDV